MDELQVVGYSADLRHLLLRDASGASRFSVRVDDELLRLLGEAAPGNGQDAAIEPEPAPEAAQEAAVPVADQRRASRLSPREIQAALRAGKPPRVIAQEAGTDEEWVARWLPPIEAERERVLADMRSCRLSRARLGPSATRFGEAVERHLAVYGLTPDDPMLRWSAARAEGDPRWSIELGYRVRGRVYLASWAFNPETGEIHARNDLATSVAWTRAAPGAARTPSLRIGVATDAAPSTPAEPVSRRKSTMSNGARKSSGASSAKRAGAKKSTAKKSTPRKSTAKKSTAKKSTAKKSTAKKSTPRKSTAKKSTPRKSTAKKATPRKSTAKKATARKATARKSTAKKATPRKSTAKRTAKKTTPRR